MKRYSYLYQKVIDLDNCKEAILEAAKAKKKKGYVRRVLARIDVYAQDLRDRIIRGDFLSPYQTEKRWDKCSDKWRTLTKHKFYPDQCAFHAIIRPLRPLILRESYYWSCANLPDRGLSRAQRGSRRMTRKNSKIKYCFKLDIKKFYPSIKHSVITDFLIDRIKDVRMIQLIVKIVNAYPKGISIGSYYSPWISEWIMKPLDVYIKCTLKAQWLVRYADDIVIGSSNKARLRFIAKQVMIFIKSRLKLDVKENYQLFKIKSETNNGRKIDFVGNCYAIGYATMRKRKAIKIMRQSRQIDRLLSRNLSLKRHICESFISRCSAFLHNNTYRMKLVYCRRNKLLRKLIGGFTCQQHLPKPSIL